MLYEVITRQQRATAEQFVRLDRIARAEMHVAPGFVECSDLEHDQIERTEALANRRVLGGQSGVAAVKSYNFV